MPKLRLLFSLEERAMLQHDWIEKNTVNMAFHLGAHHEITKGIGGILDELSVIPSCAGAENLITQWHQLIDNLHSHHALHDEALVQVLRGGEIAP